jgi:AbrB family looped-hinge helix DNA binding protein
MGTKTRIDRAGRIVIPKALRDRFGLEEGAQVELIEVPDGITLVPMTSERRIVRRGRVVAIDTGAETAPFETFSVERVRDERLDRANGLPR